MTDSTADKQSEHDDAYDKWLATDVGAIYFPESHAFGRRAWHAALAAFAVPPRRRTGINPIDAPTMVERLRRLVKVLPYEDAPNLIDAAIEAADCLEMMDELIEYPSAVSASAPITLTERERVTISNLIALARYVVVALEDGSEELPDGSMQIDDKHSNGVVLAVTVLDDLPDDRPGVTMCASAKAAWALRRIIGDGEEAPRTEIGEKHG